MGAGYPVTPPLSFDGCPYVRARKGEKTWPRALPPCLFFCLLCVAIVAADREPLWRHESRMAFDAGTREYWGKNAMTRNSKIHSFSPSDLAHGAQDTPTQQESRPLGFFFFPPPPERKQERKTKEHGNQSRKGTPFLFFSNAAMCLDGGRSHTFFLARRCNHTFSFLRMPFFPNNR